MPDPASHLKAMIFAAGRGSRLKPVTDHTPKALVKVGGKEMLLRVIEKLLGAGVRFFVINIHHHAGQMRRFIEALDFPGATFRVSDESDALLDTGGGLKKASPLLSGGQDIILYNADVLCTLDLEEMREYHQQKKALATLAVSNRPSSRYFLWDGNELAGWTNEKTGQRIMAKEALAGDLDKRAFSGIHLVSPRMLQLLHETGPFPITEAYLRLAADHRILCYEHSPEGWIDIGSPENLRKAGRMASNTNPGS